MKYGILLCLLLCGCDDYTPPAWMSAADTHVCSKEQMRKVKDETSFCSAATQYTSNYCYQTAILRNCNARDLGGNPIKRDAP